MVAQSCCVLANGRVARSVLHTRLLRRAGVSHRRASGTGDELRPVCLRPDRRGKDVHYARQARWDGGITRRNPALGEPPAAPRSTSLPCGAPPPSPLFLSFPSATLRHHLARRSSEPPPTRRAGRLGSSSRSFTPTTTRTFPPTSPFSKCTTRNSRTCSHILATSRSGQRARLRRS